MIHTNVEGIFHLTTSLLPALRAAASPEDPGEAVEAIVPLRRIGRLDGGITGCG